MTAILIDMDDFELALRILGAVQHHARPIQRDPATGFHVRLTLTKGQMEAIDKAAMRLRAYTTEREGR